MSTTSRKHRRGPPRIGANESRFGPNRSDVRDPSTSLTRNSNTKDVRRLRDRVLGAGDALDRKLEAGESFGSAFLKDSLGRGREFEAAGDALRTRQLTQMDSIGGQQNELAVGAGSAAQQRFSAPVGGGPRGFANNLNQTLRRSKTRQGIINRGDPAIRNQQLKDRLRATEASVIRRGQLQQTSADAARLEAGIDIAQTNANIGVKQAQIGAAGAVAGGIAGAFSNNGQKTGGGGGFSQSLSAGTGFSDFQIGNGFGDFDINQVGQGVNGGVMNA